MADIDLRIKLEGGSADRHELPAYDGFMSLAGLSLATSLITNYAATGKIRRRGEFLGRDAVRFNVPRQGSIIYDFSILLDPTSPFVQTIGGLTLGLATNFVYDLVKKTFSRNIGVDYKPETQMLADLDAEKHGDLEALAAAVEPSLRQAHNIIGNGVTQINVYGGTVNIGTLNEKTKEYISKNIDEGILREKDFSVASFNANSGYGSVYDFDEGRTIPIYISKSLLPRLRAAIGWGLNEYSKGTGKTISVKYYRVIAVDGTPKKYSVVDAVIPTR